MRTQRRKEAHLCIQCGNPELSTRTLCAQCAEKMRLRSFYRLAHPILDPEVIYELAFCHSLLLEHEALRFTLADRAAL